MGSTQPCIRYCGNQLSFEAKALIDLSPRHVERMLHGCA